MSADINEVFQMNEIIRMLKYKREKTRRDPISAERFGGVRRKLIFGDYNPRLSEGAVKREMSVISMRNRQKWNFDFEKERPDNGPKFRWEPVQDPKRPLISTTTQKKITDYLCKRKIIIYPEPEAKKEVSDIEGSAVKKSRSVQSEEEQETAAF